MPLMESGGILLIKYSMLSSLLTSIFLILSRFVQQKISWNHVVSSAMIVLAADECQWYVVKSIWTLCALFSFTVELLKSEWITLGRYLFRLQIREKEKNQYSQAQLWLLWDETVRSPFSGCYTRHCTGSWAVQLYRRQRSYPRLQKPLKHLYTAQWLSHIQLELGVYLAVYLR